MPRAYVASHTHRRGNLERWEIQKGSLVVYEGHGLAIRTVYGRGECFELDGAYPHAFHALDEEVEAEIFIEKKS